MSIKVFIFEDHWMCREALVSVLSKEKGIEIAGATEDVQEGIEESISFSTVARTCLEQLRMFRKGLRRQRGSSLI
ncbi:MAG: hypothetical protein AB1480_12605 [Nitrospirota bacterium]